VDINPACARHAGERIVVEIGSQDDPAFLARLCATYPPTIVIDDGSHLAHHVVYTFERMYPSVLPGGFYVVEDLSFHAGERAAKWRGFGTVSPLDYFGDIIRGRLAREAPATWGTQKYVFANTDAVTVIDSAVIFHKPSPRGPIEAAEEFAYEYLTKNDCGASAYLRLAEYFHRHWGVTAQAVRAAGKAAEIGQADARSSRQLAELLATLGRPAEAVEAAQRASFRFAGDAALWACLGLLRFRQGDAEGAEAAMKQARGIDARNAAYPYHLSVFLDRQGRAAAALEYAEAACRLVAGGAQQAEYTRHLETLRGKVM
jgi:tetratricopeptide (TPR) repeat protein